MVTLRIDAHAIALPDRVAVATPLYVRDGRIVAIGGRMDADEQVGVAGTLLPGAIDLQVNGAGGADVASGDFASLDRVAQAIADGGTTAFLPTLISAPIDTLCARLAAVTSWIARGGHAHAQPLGIHLEGPFLQVPGAHPRDALLEPTPERIGQLLEASSGRLRLVTLAPGMPGAAQAVAQFRSAGVAVSLGHGTGTAGVSECVAAGARMVTHLFNTMDRLHHREPGFSSLALDEPRLTCALIADGVHVEPSIVRLAWRVLGPERFLLTTDSSAPAGMPDGEYTLAGTQVVRRGAAVRDPEGRLAGSALTMAEAAANLRQFLPGIGPWTLARVTSGNAARLIDAADRGAIAVGAVAEFTWMAGGGALRALRLP